MTDLERIQAAALAQVEGDEVEDEVAPVAAPFSHRPGVTLPPRPRTRIEMLEEILSLQTKAIEAPTQEWTLLWIMDAQRMALALKKDMLR